MAIKVGQKVTHPYMIGEDNEPLEGTITGLPSNDCNTRYWDIQWDGDNYSEVCERCDFKLAPSHS